MQLSSLNCILFRILVNSGASRARKEMLQDCKNQFYEHTFYEFFISVKNIYVVTYFIYDQMT